MERQKGIIKSWQELTSNQKADVRKRMKPPYAFHRYKVYNGKVAYRFINELAPTPRYRGGR